MSSPPLLGNLRKKDPEVLYSVNPSMSECATAQGIRRKEVESHNEGGSEKFDKMAEQGLA